MYIITLTLSTGRRWDPWTLCAVSIASVGVFFVVYGGGGSDHPMSADMLFGDVLALLAAFSYGLYQVMYSRYAVPPDITPGTVSEPLLRNASSNVDVPPYGLFPNLLVSSIGVVTITVLWIPLLFLPFEFPTETRVWAFMALIAAMGLVFNSGMMVRLAPYAE